jgi:hypothetical protein
MFCDKFSINNVEELERYFHNGKGRRSRDRVPLSLELQWPVYRTQGG